MSWELIYMKPNPFSDITIMTQQQSIFWFNIACNNKAIRDGRPRPPRHQGFIAISYGGSELRHRSILETITHRPKCQIQKL